MEFRINIFKSFLKLINLFLSRFDLTIVKKSIIENLGADTSYNYESSKNKSVLPEHATLHLGQGHPRLIELRQLYQSIHHPAAERSIWNEKKILKKLDLVNFRADNVYVWQYNDKNFEIKYVIATNYIKTIDALKLLDLLEEDDLFGIQTFNIDNKVVSRDLLDSIVEIYFLERNLEISKWKNINILDIGAGYGRFAHRIASALPNLNRVFCVDAIPESTFLSEYYLGFRQVDKASAVTLPEINQIMENHAIDIATNICSFSECPLASISWWINLLAKYRVNYLMIVPDGGLPLSSCERDGNHLDFEKIIYSAGYRLKTRENKYLSPSVQKFGVSPTHHYLFEYAY